MTRLLWIILVPAMVLGQEPSSLNGYVKTFFVNLHTPDTGTPGVTLERRDLGLVNQRLRLQSKLNLTENLSLFAAYDINMRVQDPLLSQSFLLSLGNNPAGYRFADPQDQLYPDKDINTSFALLQNLDRFSLSWALPMADIIVGRQALAWGSARVINPTDILAPFTFDELDKEERRGVDAVRVRVPVGLLGEFDSGLVFGHDFRPENNAWYSRLKYYVRNTDVSPLLIGFQGNILAGLNIARAVGGAGVWLEAARVWTDAYGSFEVNPSDDYTRVSVGADYSFGSKTYGFVEFHLSTAGKKDPEHYIDLLSSVPFRKGAVYLFAQHYLTPGVNIQLTPLITFSGQILWNLNDLSLYMAPSLDYNIAQNIYLQAGAYVGLGPEPKPFTLESEFGTYPDSYFTSFRIYF